MAAIHLTKEEFLKKIHNYEVDGNNWNFLGDKPVLIDFFATWCGPCKALSPVIDELADEYAGKVDIYKVNVEEEEELASVFGVRSIPTLAFASKEQTPKIQVGALPKDTLKKYLDSMI